VSAVADLRVSAVADLERLAVAVAPVVEALAEVARVVVEWFRARVAELVAWLRRYGPALRRLARAHARHGRGYSSPRPLGIDGRAYRLRLLARVRRS
jgi:hypothetical protein